MSSLTLAADVGGTKCLLQLSEIDGEISRPLGKPYRFASAEFESLEDVIEAFLLAQGLNDTQLLSLTACLAVAGPVSHRGRRAHVTNLPWVLDTNAITDRLNIKKTIIINDFEAMGYGVGCLETKDSVVLQVGQPQVDGPRLVVGAGTGFGVGQLFYQGGIHQPMATEGGHVDFAPVNEEQVALLTFLQTRWRHVSVERLLSGQGLCNIHDFFVRRAPSDLRPTLVKALEEGDPAAAISAYAGRDDAPTARDTMRLFASIYGAVTGNLALVTLPRGGIFVTGGIAAKNIEHLRQDDLFLTAFLDKGRMRTLLETLPITISLDQELGLKGAAYAAALQA